VIGTPEFMSPEQLLGDPVDARSDLYALGCILHLMLTASPVLEAPTREQMVKRRLSEDPPRLQTIDPGLPDSIDRIVSRLLARTPGDRYGSAAEVRDALGGTHARRLSGDGRTLARVDTPRSAPTLVFEATEQPPAKPSRQQSKKVPVAERPRRKAPWVLAGLLVIGGAAGGIAVRNARDQESRRLARIQTESARAKVVSDSIAKAESALVVTSAVPMVDSAALVKKRQADSLANVKAALIGGVSSAITRYTNAVQQGDMAKAVEAYPNMSEREKTYWNNYLEHNELKIIVERPSNVVLSNRDSVADADVVLRVRYTDKTTKSVATSPRLHRHATLARQGTRWQLTSLAER
jgi:serine/threonine-protein kinase